MKKILFLTLLLAGFSFSFVNGQILKKITDRAKNRAENKTNEKVDAKVDQTVDSAFSKTEKGIKDATKGKGDSTLKEGNGNGNNFELDKPASIKVYSKYDFVPGEKIIVFED